MSISDEGSLPKIALSGAFKLASVYFSLSNRSVHVLYTEICILSGCLCRYQTIILIKYEKNLINILISFIKLFVLQYLQFC